MSIGRCKIYKNKKTIQTVYIINKDYVGKSFCHVKSQWTQ